MTRFLTFRSGLNNAGCSINFFKTLYYLLAIVNFAGCYISGCSAARLARVVRDDEVGGSNPLTPTIEMEVRSDSYRNSPRLSKGLVCLYTD